MRIAVIGSGTASKELPAHFQEMAGDRASTFIVNPRLSAFAYTPYEELLVDVGYVDAAQSAAAQGCDAIMINSFADYGIEAAGAVLNTPVIGAGAATLAEAAANNRRFAIVTVWPKSMEFIYQERLRATGLGSRCVGVWHVSPEVELTRLGDDKGVMQRMQRHDSDVVQRLADACRAAQTAGAEAIALGCTCMAPVGEALQRLCTAPVIESSRSGFRAALAAASKSATAQDAAKAVETPIAAARVRDPRRIPALLDAWQGRAPVASIETANDEACPVCVYITPETV